MTMKIEHADKAAEVAVRKHSTQIRTCGRTVTLPGSDQLAFFAGLGALAFLGIVEWPVAGLLMLGHALVQSRNNALVREFGEALEQA